MAQGLEPWAKKGFEKTYLRNFQRFLTYATVTHKAYTNPNFYYACTHLMNHMVGHSRDENRPKEVLFKFMREYGAIEDGNN
uniref:Mitochondrial protein n=1 Tax=Bursaphelenchus xylophilus TaxID=6326 RepID=A0A1I7S139_BURXY